MQFYDAWRSLLVPETGYHFHDLWQLFATSLVLLLTLRFVPKRENPGGRYYNTKIWFGEQRGFIAFWAIVLIAYFAFTLTPLETPVFRLFAYLGGAWFAIGFLSSLIRDRFWAQSLAAVFYLGAAYCVLALARQGVEFLDEFKFNIGSITLSVWSVLAGIITIVFALWISFALSKLVEQQVQKAPRISGSLKVLIAKVARIVIVVIAAMIALDSLGIDLTSLTVLSGAIGLGLGFGLQKVVSNFISGIILLTDNSIKPGDVIEIDGTYGWINNLRARYASVITRDGTEHLIPNEDLITLKVINWSFTNELVRMRAPIGISYKEDPHKCIELIVEAAKSIERVLEDPAPVCLLKGFGDSSVDLELRFWISDPSNGVSNVKSKVLLKVWDAFQENGIEIPFPQRDLHIRSSEVLTVQRDNPDLE